VSIQLDDILKDAIHVIKKIGDYQVEMQFSDEIFITSKSSSVDLVTSVDQYSEKELIKGLLPLVSGSELLGEETGFTGLSEDWLWVVDPLDGTTNYSQGLPIFAISVALKHHGITQLGIVYTPKLKDIFYAIRGSGTFMNGKRVFVAQKKELNQSVLATGFPYDRATHSQNNTSEIKKIIPLVRGIRRMGAAAYDLALVACGHLDGYWEYNLSIWDMAAGELLIEEAGGQMLVLDARGTSIVAGNKHMVKAIIDSLDLKTK
jgi:myo-inositol-1(or 4)-monophosphatase